MIVCSNSVASPWRTPLVGRLNLLLGRLSLVAGLLCRLFGLAPARCLERDELRIALEKRGGDLRRMLRQECPPQVGDPPIAT